LQPDRRPHDQYPKPPAASGPDPVADGEFKLITRRITVRTGAEVGLLTVFNETDRLVHVLGSWGAARGGHGLPAPRAGGGFVGRVLASGLSFGEPIDPGRDHSLGVAASGVRLTHAAGAGIRSPGGPPGALCLGFAARPSDEPRTLWRIESYARVASLCLDERGALDGLLATARRDGLTGCLNYAAIWAELDREIRRSERHGRELSCYFIDLDHFKRVAQWRPGSTADGLLGAADAALLRAKDGGSGIVAGAAGAVAAGAGRDGAWGPS
jgi:hypothetical protein